MSLAEENVLLGLDIGGSYCKGIVLNTHHEVVKFLEFPSCANEGPDSVREALNEYLPSIFNNFPVGSIGVGCAGSVNPKTGIVRSSPNFANWKDVNLRQWFERDFGISPIIHNDANCAAYAEYILGAGRGSENIVLLTLGTGIGGGLILNKKLFIGSTGTAGELGHFCIQPDGVECPCGHRGCFERYCSKSALSRQFPHLSAEEIFEMSEHEPFRSGVRRFLGYLKAGLVGIANVFDPDVMILGGAISLGLLPYKSELQVWINEHAFPSVSENVRIEWAKFQKEAGALGAALLSNQ